METAAVLDAIAADFDHLRKVAASEARGGDADTLFSEAIEAAARRAARFDGANLGGWFRAVCRSLRTDAYRAAAREAARLERYAVARGINSAEVAVYDNVAAVDLGDTLAEALATLPESHRLAVLAVDAEGLKYREAADRLGVPEATVKTWVRRGRQALQAALADAEAA
jgi:RNA polymerase sigma-70 factor (ECF subfamily)